MIISHLAEFEKAELLRSLEQIAAAIERAQLRSQRERESERAMRLTGLALRADVVGSLIRDVRGSTVQS